MLGEMSAAVSHELNQPLAAMKTYLAGARLLLQRKRGDEALSSFQRIDDLIERMGAITKQLKSYARKGGDAFEPLDFRGCVASALSMMEPQLKSRKVTITRTMPPTPVIVMADSVRLEQVIINLLRNALDATKMTRDAQIDLILSAGAVLHYQEGGRRRRAGPCHFLGDRERPGGTPDSAQRPCRRRGVRGAVAARGRRCRSGRMNGDGHGPGNEDRDR